MDSLYQFIIFSIFLFVVSVYLLRNPVYCILSFVVVVAHVVFLLIALETEYLAYILAIVYIGAIVVLFLFVIMMFYIKKGIKKGIPLSLILQGILLGAISSYLYLNLDFNLILKYTDIIKFNLSNNDFTFLIGYTLFDLWPFFTIIAAILMIIGIIGSISLTLKSVINLLGENKLRKKIWSTLRFRRAVQMDMYHTRDYTVTFLRKRRVPKHKRWTCSLPPNFVDFFPLTQFHDDY